MIWLGAAFFPIQFLPGTVRRAGHNASPVAPFADVGAQPGYCFVVSRRWFECAQMLALIGAIGTLVFVYAIGYLGHEPRRGKIFLILPLFVFAMIGAVSADNIVVLFAFWELTSITSFLLVGFNHQAPSARESARQALLVTMGGGFALLGGIDVAGAVGRQLVAVRHNRSGSGAY
jgi:formate hydrogenlyase subunit 3/multisubunit Na+/H+ antiporter MnhD subunit